MNKVASNSFVRGSGLAAVFAALVLAGCSSVPLTEVPIVDRNAKAEGAATATPVTSFGAVRDSGRTHTVSVGDTIYNIAMRYGVTSKDLMQLNAVTDPTQLALGRVLHIPVSTTEARSVTTLPEGVRVSRVESAAPIETAPKTSTSQTPSVAAPSQAESAAPEQTAKSASAAEKPAAVVPGTRMIWPVRGKVLSDFAKNGMGLDISGTTGSVVVAAGDGQVLFVGNGVSGYGNLVIVKHTPTLVTAYGHNSKVVVKPNDRVKAGQKIAELGSTEASQPMLRFEVRDKGQPVDPMKYLPAQRN